MRTTQRTLECLEKLNRKIYFAEKKAVSLLAENSQKSMEAYKTVYSIHKKLIKLSECLEKFILLEQASYLQLFNLKKTFTHSGYREKYAPNIQFSNDPICTFVDCYNICCYKILLTIRKILYQAKINRYFIKTIPPHSSAIEASWFAFFRFINQPLPCIDEKNSLIKPQEVMYYSPQLLKTAKQC